MIKHDRSIVLYNCDAKEEVGIFKTQSLAARYLFGTSGKKVSHISESARRKLRIYNSIFDFPVAVRFSTPNQSVILGDKDFIILNGYNTPEYHKMKGFDSCKESMRIEGNERISRYNLERGNKKINDYKEPTKC